MSIFTLTISRLTISNLPWFMDLTFQVPMQYCSLQHQTLLPPPVTSTTGCCFCFGSISSFFLGLFLYWFPGAHWAPTDLGSSSFSDSLILIFVLHQGSPGASWQLRNRKGCKCCDLFCSETPTRGRLHTLIWSWVFSYHLKCHLGVGLHCLEGRCGRQNSDMASTFLALGDAHLLLVI